MHLNTRSNGSTRRLALRRLGQRRNVNSAEVVLRAARATMRRKKYCVLATSSDAGLDARVLQPFPPEADFCVWFGTSTRSRKVAQLRADERATLVYEDDGRAACVVLTGKARVIQDVDERRRRFMSAWWAFFPEGPEGEDYVLLRFEPERIEVWDAMRRVTPEPFGLRAARLARHDGAWRLV